MIIRNGTAVTFLVGPILDSAGVAVTTGLSRTDLKATKNGSVVALSVTSSLTHDHSGKWLLVLSAVDISAVGRMQISLDATTNIMPVVNLTVIEEVVYDALYAASATGLLPAQLADGVTHGGSTAALSLQSIAVSNSVGNAVSFQSTGSNGKGLVIAGNGSGNGVDIDAGATGIGMIVSGGATSGVGMKIEAPIGSASGALDVMAISGDYCTKFVCTGSNPAMFIENSGAGPGLRIESAYGNAVETDSPNGYAYYTDDGVYFESLSIGTAIFVASQQATGSDGFLLDSTQPNYTPATAAALSTMQGNVTTILGYTDILDDGTNGLAAIRAWAESTYGAVGTPATGTVSSDLAAIAGYIDTEVGAIKAVTDQFVFTVANQVDANALTGGGGASAADVADAVCDELLSAHTIPGSVAAGISSASAAGDPMGVDLPGAYSGSDAGYLLYQTYLAAQVLGNTPTEQLRQSGQDLIWNLGETHTETINTVGDYSATPITLVITDPSLNVIATITNASFTAKGSTSVSFAIPTAVSASVRKLLWAIHEDDNGNRSRDFGHLVIRKIAIE